MNHHLKRILTDAAGYGLILLGIALGWLPGPGGIPLVLAGLGLLSINNVWAKRIRDYLIDHGGKVVQLLFPKHRWVQIGYDILVVLLIVAVGLLIRSHAAIWQIGLAIVLFFIALVIAGLNRERLARLRENVSKRKH